MRNLRTPKNRVQKMTHEDITNHLVRDMFSTFDV